MLCYSWSASLWFWYIDKPEEDFVLDTKLCCTPRSAYNCPLCTAQRWASCHTHLSCVMTRRIGV